MLKLRRVQEDFVAKAIENAKSGKNKLTAEMHPGSGKTIANNVSNNDLYKLGLIDTTLYLSPRLNLCEQVELDWKKTRSLLSGRTMGSIIHRSNEEPLIRSTTDGIPQFGVAATMQSVVSNPGVYLRFARKYKDRFSLTIDEAQTAGYDPEGTGSTKVAEVLETLIEFARYLFIMTGTPYRLDNKPIWQAEYTEPNERGFKSLIADVKSGYMEGVSEKYLRKFQFELFDAKALKKDLITNNYEELTLSKMDHSLRSILEHPDFWYDSVDKTVSTLHGMRTIWSGYQGLIGAASQSHARTIVKYLRDRHNVNALLAVSDEVAALNNLKLFKKEGSPYEILVTVGMAHMGYDCPTITVVTCLGPFRHVGWLDQFFGRGWRVVGNRPFEEQVVICIVPDDIKMFQYVTNKRSQSEAGLREIAKREDIGGGIWTPPIEQPSVIISASVLPPRLMGMNENDDIDSSANQQVDLAIQEYDLPAITKPGLHRLFKDKGLLKKDISMPKSPILQDDRNEEENLKNLRKQLYVACKSIDRYMINNHGKEHGYTAKTLKGIFHSKESPGNLGAIELRKRILYVNDWLNNINNKHNTL